MSRIHGYITLSILILLLAATGVWYAAAPLVYGTRTAALPFIQEQKPLHEGNHLVVHIGDMTVELRQGTTTLHTLPIISVGKPGSYYETIGGAYENDYKIRNHFSSIGHVYMPWSTHVFGNFFIHGIPYYENGTEVSSTYSGGCIRMSNEHAKMIYEFIEKGTPIIITKDKDTDFQPTKQASPTLLSIDMTRLMVGAISLEVLSQDNPIRNTDGTMTTRRTLLPRLLAERDDSVSFTLAHDRGEDAFLTYMNEKARALGMTNTRFNSLTDPALTTKEDAERFNSYISDYKSYLLTLVPVEG